jgi:hypothetical protein
VHDIDKGQPEQWCEEQPLRSHQSTVPPKRPLRGMGSQSALARRHPQDLALRPAAACPPLILSGHAPRSRCVLRPVQQPHRSFRKTYPIKGSILKVLE